MRSFFEQFKKFAMRGNVVDLAVAVVIGAAFGKIVSSLVNNIVMPFVGLLLGGVNFSALKVTIGEAEITYGVFIQSIVDFLIIALAIFVAVKVINKLQEEEKQSSEGVMSKKASEEVVLLTEIRDILKK